MMVEIYAIEIIFKTQKLFNFTTLLHWFINSIKVEKSGSIPTPSPSVKIQILGGKVCFECKGKTLLGFVNKLLKTKSLLTSPSNIVPYYLK